jgi:hypothetical protein
MNSQAGGVSLFVVKGQQTHDLSSKVSKRTRRGAGRSHGSTKKEHSSRDVAASATEPLGTPRDPTGLLRLAAGLSFCDIDPLRTF